MARRSGCSVGCQRCLIGIMICIDVCFSVSLRFLGPVLVLLAQRAAADIEAVEHAYPGATG